MDQDKQLTTADMASAGTRMAPEQSSTPLFVPQEAQQFRSKWDEIQSGFVDEPRRAVEQADGLVAEAIKRLAEVFARNAPILKSSGIGAGTFLPRICG